MQESIKVSFAGELAESARIPVYEGSDSLWGISRSLMIAVNYLAEGRVRRRDFVQRDYQINLVAYQPGSFETVIEILTNPYAQGVGGVLGGGVAGNLLTDFIKSIFRRAVGEKAEPTIEAMEAEGTLNAGDTGAIVDAIEPAMRRAHTIINHGAGNITIVGGTGNMVNLDRSTKEYVWTSIRDDGIKTKLFSVASYSANSGTGRAFDFEAGKTIPFEIAKEIDRESLTSILASMSSYALRRKLGENLKSSVALKYQSIVSVDGRTKKIIVLKARNELTDL
jgi:hypothetical protein